MQKAQQAWKAMDRLRLMKTFVAVVETGSFTAAALKIRASRSLMTRHIAHLEEHLGARLLNRTTQKLSVTDSGKQYYHFCARFLDELEHEETHLASNRTKLRGDIRLMAPKSFGSMYLASAVAEFVLRHPKINISLFLDDQPPDLGYFTDKGFDLAVRTADAADSSLVCRKIASLRWVVCGTGEFFRRHQMPKIPADLAALPCLHFGLDQKYELAFTGPGGECRTTIRGPISANSVIVLRAAALRGVGLLICPIYCVAEDLRQGNLIEILKDYSLKPNVLGLIYARDRFQPARVSVFIDFLMSWYAHPDWEETAPGHNGPSSPKIRSDPMRRKANGHKA
jgi:DNA-binding transcriptional LysR family regulator